jgi:hypothetical protein
MQYAERGCEREAPVAMETSQLALLILVAMTGTWTGADSLKLRKYPQRDTVLSGKLSY